MSSTDFYRAFEDRYRGPRELIRKRLEAYRPFFEPLLGVYRPANAIDLGCGRGEWLELLQEAGFQPQGVDLDAGMLAACTERGLSVTQGDAIAHLKSLADESQCIVSAFHVAEHIAFADLQALVQHALRVLKPGGLLILETPNPENLVVGTSSFYLDPTHLRPIPPLLLSFLPEHYGFARVCTVRLQESQELHQRSGITLIEVLGGVSPDYAVVAQKAATPEISARCDAAFAAPYGIQLNELAARYDRDRKENDVEKVHNVLQALRGDLTSLNTLVDVKKTEAVELKAYVEKLQLQNVQLSAAVATSQMESARMSLFVREAELKASNAVIQHAALLGSLSWRITQPLRAIGSIAVGKMPRVHADKKSLTIRNAINTVLLLGVDVLQAPIAFVMRPVLKNRSISSRLNRVLLNRLPGLHHQLQDIARKRGLIAEVISYPSSSSTFGATKKKSALHLKNIPRRDAGILMTEHVTQYADKAASEKQASFDIDAIMANLKNIDISDINSFSR